MCGPAHAHAHDIVYIKVVGSRCTWARVRCVPVLFNGTPVGWLRVWLSLGIQISSAMACPNTIIVSWVRQTGRPVRSTECTVEGHVSLANFESRRVQENKFVTLGHPNLPHDVLWEMSLPLRLDCFCSGAHKTQAPRSLRSAQRNAMQLVLCVVWVR